MDPVVANLSVCLSNVYTVHALSWIDEIVFQIQRKTTVKLALCGFDKLLSYCESQNRHIAFDFFHQLQGNHCIASYHATK